MKLNDRNVRANDTAWKNKATDNYKQSATVHDLHVGDLVLIEWQKSRKMQTRYDPSPFTVVTIKGSMVTVTRNGRSLARNRSFLKLWMRADEAQALPRLQPTLQEQCELEPLTPWEFDPAMTERIDEQLPAICRQPANAPHVLTNNIPAARQGLMQNVSAPRVRILTHTRSTQTSRTLVHPHPSRARRAPPRAQCMHASSGFFSSIAHHQQQRRDNAVARAAEHADATRLTARTQSQRKASPLVQHHI